MAAKADTIDVAYDEVSRGVMALVFDEPFYGHFLSGLNRVVTATGTRTAAVALRSARPIMLINPDFFLGQLTRKSERVAVIKHEVLHLLLKHLQRIDWARTDAFVFNLAADLVVNQLIGNKWTLPTGAITLDTFPMIPLKADLTVEQYYELLMKHRHEIPPGLVASHSDHDTWRDALADDDTSLAEHEVARLARRARDRSGRSYGLLDEQVRTIVDAYIDQLEPTVDWRRALRMFSNSSRQTRIKSTLRRPSKRYGTYPGIKVKRFHRIVAAVDTSGSVSDADLSDFFAEIVGIWRQGSEVTIVECDQIVQSVWSYRGGSLPSSVGGRGGTAFDPVFEWVRDQTSAFDAVIYLTDGYAQQPVVDPRCSVLWVLTPDGTDDHLAFGRSVRIDRQV